MAGYHIAEITRGDAFRGLEFAAIMSNDTKNAFESGYRK